MRKDETFKYFSFILLLFLSTSLAHRHEHKCVHDEMNVTLVPGMEHEISNSA